MCYSIDMKKMIREFCQGIYDGMASKKEFIEKYTFDEVYHIVLNAFYALVLKVFTLILGIVACILASIKMDIRFSALFWTGITVWICWLYSDEDLKQLASFFHDIMNINTDAQE